jgi:hypothetical protein
MPAYGDILRDLKDGHLVMVTTKVGPWCPGDWWYLKRCDTTDPANVFATQDGAESADHLTNPLLFAAIGVLPERHPIRDYIDNQTGARGRVYTDAEILDAVSEGRDRRRE